MATRVNRADTAANKKQGKHPSRSDRRLVPMQVVNTIANHRGELALRYTTEGEGLSPPLSWVSSKSQTAEFALICEDLDSGLTESKVHWLVYRIPSVVNHLPEGIPMGDQIFSVIGAPLQGENSFGIVGYTPPSLDPFESWHHYQFRIYALDSALKNLRPGMTKGELLEAMQHHIIESADLICRYRRTNHKAA